jgi:hypothetical protein
LLHRVNQIETESPMDTLALGLFWIVMILSAAPANAQTYDPAYPIRIQTVGIAGNTIECLYVSMDQCKLSASGGAAQCITNPYFAGAPGRMSGSPH